MEGRQWQNFSLYLGCLANQSRSPSAGLIGEGRGALSLTRRHHEALAELEGAVGPARSAAEDADRLRQLFHNADLSVGDSTKCWRSSRRSPCTHYALGDV